MNIMLLNIVIIFYLAVIVYLGYKGWKSTKSAEDYMVAGRGMHPTLMALSYGSTFISTSAIVGFGGIAGLYGMGLLWLPFLNILIGVYIAFIFYGKRLRKMSHNLRALTFPEMLGRRFDSSFIQVFAGLVIFLGMPLYAAVVLIGEARFVETTLAVDFNLALLGLSIITALYVVWGGLKGVIYTDAFQGAIMLFGMAILLVMTYSQLGGVTAAHQALTNMADKVPANLQTLGNRGWTASPQAGSTWWWTMVSSIILGVGIGVLAMPQLAVRFMTVKSNRELNRAVPIGGLFILMCTFVPYIVGSLSNVYFYNTTGHIAIDVAKGNADNIIPLFINAAMPEWFVYVFLLTLLAAAMSTSSSQFHTQGTAIARDVYETLSGKKGGASVLITRIGIVCSIIIAVILGYMLPTNIIARGTSIFFGLCAAAFLPMYTAGLFWKRANKEGAIASLVFGTFASLFWLVFVHGSEAKPLGVCKWLFGTDTLITTMPWPVVDPTVIALPLSVIVLVAVSLLSPPPKGAHVDKCFSGVK